MSEKGVFIGQACEGHLGSYKNKEDIRPIVFSVETSVAKRNLGDVCNIYGKNVLDVVV